MEVIDMTGQPRSDKDLEEAIQVITKCALDPLSLPPALGVHLMDIRAFLFELQSIRALIAKAQAERKEKEAQEVRTGRDERPDDEFEQRPLDPSDY